MNNKKKTQKEIEDMPYDEYMEYTKGMSYDEYFPDALKHLDRRYGSKQDKNTEKDQDVVDSIASFLLDLEPDNKPAVRLRGVQWVDGKHVKEDDPLDKLDRKSLSKYIRGEHKKE